MDRASSLALLIFVICTFQCAGAKHVDLSLKASNSEILSDALRQATDALAVQRDDAHAQIDDAANNQLIPTLASEIHELIEAANTTFGPLGTTMHAKIDETEALGPSYARCTEGQREKADAIVADGYRNLANCGGEIDYLLIGYIEQLSFYTISSDEMYEVAVVSASSCVPNEEPSDEDTAIALRCIDDQVLFAEGRYLELSESLSDFVLSTNEQAQMIRDNTPRCVDTAKHHAGDLTGYFLFTMDTCVSEVNQSTSTGNTDSSSTSLNTGDTTTVAAS